MVKLLSGVPPADEVLQSLLPKIKQLEAKQIIPQLAILHVSKNLAANSYIKIKQRIAKSIGIKTELNCYDEDVSTSRLLEDISLFNSNPLIHGIICQLPLPKTICSQTIAEAIDPAKDVDCFHPQNIGQLALGNANFSSCTPAGILYMLNYYDINLAGKTVLVIGRSNIVGKPLAIMMIQKEINASVIIAHSYTKNLSELCATADIIVAAAGKPNLLQKQDFKKTAVIIDVGINKSPDESKKNKLCGDVDFDKVAPQIQAISPVPKGVGPLTVAMLMKNIVQACCQQNNIS